MHVQLNIDKVFILLTNSLASFDLCESMASISSTDEFARPPHSDAT
jgi:hypothetical protein